MLWVADGEILKTGVEILADSGCVGDEVVAFNLVDNGTEKQGTDGVTHPSVELAVRLVGAQLGVAVVVAGSLCLLGKGDHVRRVLKFPVLMSPEAAGGTDTGLDLVDDEEDSMTTGEGAELAEEVWAGVVVTTLALDGLNDDGGGGKMPVLDKMLDFIEAGLLGSGVLGGMLIEGVLELGEGSLGPVKGRDIELVDSLGAGSRQGTKEAAVEACLEGQDGKLGGTGALVVHDGLEFLGSEVDVAASALLLAAVHEGSLVRRLVGIGAGHRGEDIVQALGSGLENSRLENIGPVAAGEVAQGRTVDDGADHLGAGSGLCQGRVVVTKSDGGNLGEPASLFSL